MKNEIFKIFNRKYWKLLYKTTTFVELICRYQSVPTLKYFEIGKDTEGYWVDAKINKENKKGIVKEAKDLKSAINEVIKQLPLESNKILLKFLTEDFVRN